MMAVDKENLREACAANPGMTIALGTDDVLAMLDDLDGKDLALAFCRKNLQHMIDQTTPLEPVPGDPMWSRRIQLDQVIAERDAALAELEACRKDAKRYRYLLENAVSKHSAEQAPVLVCQFDLPADGWREEVSRRIDAAVSLRAIHD